MPGKVNPVIPEVVSQIAFLVIGNDTTITMAAEDGQLELNAFEPVIFYKLFEPLTCLTGAVRTLRINCITGIIANTQRCKELVDNSVGIVTALCLYLGYKQSAKIAKEALAKGVRVHDLIVAYQLMDEKKVRRNLKSLFYDVNIYQIATQQNDKTIKGKTKRLPFFYVYSKQF